MRIIQCILSADGAAVRYQNSFAESAQDLSRQSIISHTPEKFPFTLRHFVNLFRDVIYHHKSLQDNRIPDYFRTAVQLILQLKTTMTTTGCISSG